MEQKQTAMQKLIDEIVEHLTYDDDLTDEARGVLEKIRVKCEGKLEMEKQQIMDAYDDGANERHNDPVNGEQYYNQEYGKQ